MLLRRLTHSQLASLTSGVSTCSGLVSKGKELRIDDVLSTVKQWP